MAIIPQEEKVFMVSNSTNTTYSGSAALKAMQQWYTMQDVTDTVKPYKVYTALLTQSGGADPYILSEGYLTIGITYVIKDTEGSPDFTNVGAPNNNIGTFFVATGTTPNKWGSGLLEFDKGAPVATVLENTIGNVWFTYVDEGTYELNSDGLFKENNTFCSISTTSDNMDPSATFTIPVVEPNVIEIHSDANLNRTDSLLNRTPIEIRVYN
jgi:hypothetical protein